MKATHYEDTSMIEFAMTTVLNEVLKPMELKKIFEMLITRSECCIATKGTK